MNKKHLFWIIPLVLLLGLGIGIRLGINLGFASAEAFTEWGCEVGVDTLELCTDMVQYMVEFNGSTEDAIKQYTIDKNDSIIELGNKYGLMGEEELST